MSFLDALYDYLAAHEDLVALLGSSADSTGKSFPWIFQDSLKVTVEGTSRSALVLSTGTAGSPNEHNTVRFPQLVVELFIDPQRINGVVSFDDTRARAEAIYSECNRWLHIPYNCDVQMGVFRVFRLVSEGEPSYFPVMDGDHMRQVRFTYSLAHY